MIEDLLKMGFKQWDWYSQPHCGRFHFPMRFGDEIVTVYVDVKDQLECSLSTGGFIESVLLPGIKTIEQAKALILSIKGE